jgi:hypothetical protein
VTARGHDPARRREARFLARAEQVRRDRGVSLKEAARQLRQTREKVRLVAIGEMTPAVLIRELRTPPPELRKSLHDTRGKAVRS